MKGGRQEEPLLLCCGCALTPHLPLVPLPPRTYLRHSRTLLATSGGPAFSMSPLLHSNLQHLSLQLFCFLSSFMSFSCSGSSSTSSFGSLSPRCPATVVREHHHGGTGWRPWKGMPRRMAGHLSPCLLPSFTSLPHSSCKVHSSAHRPYSPVTPLLPEIQYVSLRACLHAVAL